MLYEFRTLKDRRHASLIMLAGCDNDIEAILIAQEFLRKGEGLEVWRGDELVYRLAARVRTRRAPNVTRDKVGGWLEAAKRLFPWKAPSAGIKH
jgi:hypothetical protein